MKKNKAKKLSRNGSSSTAVRIEYTDPTAAAVCVAGTFNEWRPEATPMVAVGDEHAERLWLPQRHVAAIRAMVGRHRTRDRALEFGDLRRFVPGTDVFSRQSDGTTIAAQYGREGITLKPANMDRVNGWAEVLQRLGDPDAGLKGSLFIHRRCGRLAETLPSLQHDPNRPEDVLKVDADEDGVGGDDDADALRYLVATKSRTIAQRKLRGALVLTKAAASSSSDAVSLPKSRKDVGGYGQTMASHRRRLEQLEAQMEELRRKIGRAPHKTATKSRTSAPRKLRGL